MLNPITPLLIEIQDDVRNDFNWSLSADEESAHNLVNAASKMMSVKGAVERLTESLKAAPLIAILGASVEPEEILMLPENCLLVAADGSVGVLNELPPKQSESAWQRLVLIVSDGDGGDAMLEASRKGIPFALHAHGDNQKEWRELLPILAKYCPTLIMTHQCPETIESMYNPGGFTDGDRAACIVAAFGISIESIKLIGFCSNKIGRWTGITDPIRKLRKLKWMDRVLEILKGAS